MINKASAAVAAWLVKKGAVSPSDEPLYEYAFFSFLITAIPIVFISVIGLILGMFFEGLMLIVPFVLIRKFSGGYHLKSSNLCLVCSTLILAAFLLLARGIIHLSLDIPFIIAALVAAVSLMVFSPIDSEERKLSDKERAAFKVIARIMALAMSIVWIALMYFGFRTAAVCIGCGIILSAVLQLPCILKKFTHRTNG